MRFDYDGQNVDAIYDGSGNLLRRYVFGPNVDEPLVWFEGTGTADTRYMDGDERGSVVRVTNATGSLMRANSYDEFGSPSTTNLGRFQYAGQVWLSEVGLYYDKARFYSPTLGRFMQPDPIGYDDGVNWYAYVGNDPINSIDPLGLGAGCEPAKNDEIVSCGQRLGVEPNDPFTASGGSKDPTTLGGKQPQDTGPDIVVTGHRCGLSAAFSKNSQALIGDSVGFAAALFLPGGKPAAALVGLVVGAGTLINTAKTSDIDRPGLTSSSLALGIAGFHIAAAGPLAEAYKATSFIAKNLPGISQIVAGGAVVLDLANVALDYKQCP